MEDYWDIDSVLLAHEKLPATFYSEANNLGWLDRSGTSKPDGTLAGSKRVELPYWFCEALLQQNLIELLIPSVFAPTMRSNLTADASVVSLHSTPYFYALAKKIMPRVDRSESEAIQQTLVTAYAQRYNMILDRSRNWKDADYAPFTKTLAKPESDLFLEGYRATSDFDSWKSQNNNRIQASELLSSARATDLNHRAAVAEGKPQKRRRDQTTLR